MEALLSDVGSDWLTENGENIKEIQWPWISTHARILSVQTIRMAIGVDHFEYRALHAYISIVLVIFQWDQVYCIDYIQRSVYILK